MFDDESEIQLIKNKRNLQRKPNIIIIVWIETYDENDIREIENIIKNIKLNDDYIGLIAKENGAYISNKIKGIRFIDTTGWYLNGHDIQYTTEECKKEINKQYNE